VSYSALGAIRDDIIALVEGITPTADARQRWSYIPRTRATSDRPRAFVLEVGQHDGGRFFGGGEREVHRTFTVVTVYSGEDVDDQIEADEVDLIEALQPSSTFPSGTWGAVRVRKALPVGRKESATKVEVRFPFMCIYRYPCTVR